MLRILFLLVAISKTSASFYVNKAVAKIEGEATGIVTFTQDTIDGEVHVTGEISNLSAGNHGFHIHIFGNITEGCISAGPHFNPDKKDHGDIQAEQRHVGDLGNIKAEKTGEASIDIKDKLISLNGKNSIVGRAIVVHKGEDDLGLGGHEESKTTGNSGKRAGCGIIGIGSVNESSSSSTPIIGLLGFIAAFLPIIYNESRINQKLYTYY